jgi:hypothetical protein
MKYTLPIALLAAISSLPFPAYAASLVITPEPAGVQQEFSATVSFSPEGKTFNVVQGIIHLPYGLIVTKISTGGSALLLWPTPPTYSPATGDVTFLGGIPGHGLSATTDATLFTLYLKSTLSNTYEITAQGVTANLADGAGTKVSVTTLPTPLTIGVTNAPNIHAVVDHSAPYAIVTSIGSDNSLFGGTPFVSFYGKDTGLGIVQYEAREGWFGQYETVQQYYVLKDAGKSPVWIRAIDGAGNRTTVHVNGTGGLLYYGISFVPYLLAFLVILLVGYLIYRRRQR